MTNETDKKTDQTIKTMLLHYKNPRQNDSGLRSQTIDLQHLEDERD